MPVLIQLAWCTASQLIQFLIGPVITSLHPVQILETF